MEQQEGLNGISVVTTKAERKQFLNFPYQHYEGDPNFVPPLYIDQKKLIDTEKNPFYDNADIELFIAERDDKMVGRIAAIHNHAYNDYHNENAGFFGFFESINDPSVVKLLFRVAEDWLRNRGVAKILGPTNPGTFDVLGILVDGFDDPPTFMMPYNKTYYDELIKGVGYEKAEDLLAFKIVEESANLERLERAEKILRRRYPEITFRKVDLKQIKREAEIIRTITNEAWADNWGFVPLTEDEIKAAASDLKLVVDPDISYICEMDGKPVAYTVGVPDLNKVLINIKRGRLLPFGIFKLLYGRRKTPDIYRTILMGVLPEYRNRGIEALLNKTAIDSALGKGYDKSELSWVLESNIEMIRLAEKLGAYEDKRYRIYGKEL